MLRVAYLFERFPSFGQTFCYREVAELVRQGADVSIFSIRQPADEPAQDWDETIVRRVIYLPPEAKLVEEIDRAICSGALSGEIEHSLKGWGRQSDFLRLYQAAYVGMRLRESGIKRVHAHFGGMAARTAYWLKEFFGIDYSLTVHANDIFAPRPFVVDLPKLFSAATAIVAVSDFAARRLREEFPEEARKIHRVYNGLDLSGFKAPRFPAGPPLIISIGRLIEKKGFRDLIAACEILRDRCDFRCEIIGDGPLEETLSKQIATAGLDGNVQLLGPRPQHEIVERLARATLFVLPCRPGADGDMDNLPTVIMEAMAAGLPVVSTALVGIPEMVQAGVTGELVQPNDLAMLAEAMEPFLLNPARAREFGERGRALAGEKFSIAQNAAALASILSA